MLSFYLYLQTVSSRKIYFISHVTVDYCIRDNSIMYTHHCLSTLFYILRDKIYKQITPRYCTRFYMHIVFVPCQDGGLHLVRHSRELGFSWGRPEFRCTARDVGRRGTDRWGLRVLFLFLVASLGGLRPNPPWLLVVVVVDRKWHPSQIQCA